MRGAASRAVLLGAVGAACLFSPSAGLRAAAGAEAEVSLDWQRCVRLALSNNPSLAAARRGSDKADADRRAARGRRLPQVSADASAGYGGGQDGAPAGSYSYGLSARQPLFDGGRLAAQSGQADRGVELAGIRYDGASADRRWSLRAAFVGLLEAQEMTGIASEILQRRSQTTRLIGMRHEAGREHRGALLTAQAKEAQAEADAAAARRNLETARRSLLAELGEQRAGGRVEAAGSLAEAPLPDRRQPDFEVLAARTPAVREAAVQTESARLALAAAKSERYPEASATARAGGSGRSESGEAREWSAGVGLSVPVWRGGATGAGVAAAMSAWLRQEEEQRAARNAAAASLAARWAAWQNACDRVDVQNKFLAAAEERARISEAQYSAGLLAFDNWIIIEDEYVLARKGLVGAVVDATLAHADWTRALGGTLEDEIR